jgi:DeoR/GlpR family transcriptional regulator of sugar metabolism
MQFRAIRETPSGRGAGLLPSERRRQLQERLARDRVLEVPELAELLQVSQATVRRDLERLEREGQLQRVRGGAVVPTGLGDTAEPMHREKVRAQAAAKQAIARCIAARVRPGDVIALDSGTTTLAIAMALRTLEYATVITTDLQIAVALADTAGIDVIIVGGSVRRGLYTVVGPLAERTLEALNVGTAYVGADAIDLERGVTNASLSEVAVKRALLASARERVLVADHSKFDHVSLAEVAKLDRFDEIVTDAQLPPAVVERYRAAGSQLTLAHLEEPRP